jgi:hypothetical protein
MADPGMTLEEMKQFVRQKIAIGDVNFGPEFVDHGADVPSGLPPGPEGAKQYPGGALKRFPDMHMIIEDIIAEGDKVVVRNTWTGTDRQAQAGAVVQVGDGPALI